MENINFRTGKIIFNEFHIDFSKPFSKQLECLSEDLLQIKYGDNYLIDVGWYPESEVEGCFIIQVIENENWAKPISSIQCKKEETLVKNLKKAVDIAEKLCRIHFVGKSMVEKRQDY